MLEKLDKIDRKILYELDNNARVPCSKIAKKLRISKEAVNYRIKKLEKNKIIKNYQLVLNLYKLGVIQFKICLSFQHLTSKNLEEKIELLKKEEKIKWIVSCKGDWELIISSEVNSLEEIDELKNKILGIFAHKIYKKDISILTEAITYNRDYLLEKQTKNISKILMKKEELINLDEIDIKILKELSKNSRESYIDIAKKINSNPRIVRYRIKELIKQKVILGFKIALNYEKLGIYSYKLFITLDNPEKNKINSLIEYFNKNKNIIHHVKVLGRWDLEPEYEINSQKEFDLLITDLNDKYVDIIKNIETIQIKQVHKFVYF